MGPKTPEVLQIKIKIDLFVSNLQVESLLASKNHLSFYIWLINRFCFFTFSLNSVFQLKIHQNEVQRIIWYRTLTVLVLNMKCVIF